MADPLSGFARRYARVLRRYLAHEQEAALEQAYELGRRAVVKGLGVLDMVRIHEKALEQTVWRTHPPSRNLHALESAETFFLETLSPFEMTHRGFRETALRLRRAVKTLEKRNVELAATNRKLGLEIRERKRTEKALRESERHFRELFEQARAMEENLRSLSNQVLHAQEEERKRVSRELHDEVGQALTAVSVSLAMLNKAGATHPEFPHQKVADAQQLLRGTMDTVHHFARELRPALLDELGLLPALRSYTRSFAERTGLHVHLQATALCEHLDSQQKTVVFRVAQESLTNVAKHAQATRVEVTLCKHRSGLCMEVADNGKSFDQNPLNSGKTRKRLGLLGMQERVRLVNGKFTIKAAPGKGTTVRVVIPFRKPEVTEQTSELKAQRAEVRLASAEHAGTSVFSSHSSVLPSEEFPERTDFHPPVLTTSRNCYGQNQSSIG